MKCPDCPHLSGGHQKRAVCCWDQAKHDEAVRLEEQQRRREQQAVKPAQPSVHTGPNRAKRRAAEAAARRRGRTAP